MKISHIKPQINDTPLSGDSVIAVGFGSASVTRDGELVYDEDRVDEENFWTCADAENAARKDPFHDWRISFYAPLYEAVYQRHAAGKWMLIEKGKGFA